jgi:hypothetical protein
MNYIASKLIHSTYNLQFLRENWIPEFLNGRLEEQYTPWK